MLRPDSRIVQTRRYGVGINDLTVIILQKIGLVAMQNARLATLEAGRMLAGLDPVPGGFDTDQAHAFVLNEGVEQSHRIGAAANTGNSRIGETPLALKKLFPGLPANDGLEIAHHGRIGMRSGNRANHVERVGDIRHPVAQRLIHRVLQRARSRGDRHHVRAQKLHTKDVGRLSGDIGRAHEHRAWQTKTRGHSCGRYTMLPSTGFRDDPRLAHAFGQQDLPQAVIHLVAARMIEFITLEPDLGPAKMLGQTFRIVQRRRLSDVIAQEFIHLRAEIHIPLGIFIGLLQVEDERHEGFSNITPAKIAKSAFGIRPGRQRIRSGVDRGGIAHGYLLYADD